MTAEGQQMPFLDQKVAEKLAAELAMSMRARVNEKLGIDKPREKSVAEQMEEIMGQLQRMLQEKEKSAKSVFDSSSDKGLLSQKKLSLFLDYLAESWENAERFFEEKNIERLQSIFSEVQEGVVIGNKLEKVVISDGEKKRDAHVMPEKRKEFSDEKLFRVLVKFLQPRLPFTLSNPDSGEKLVIMSASDEVIEFRYNKIVTKTKPGQIKKFLQFLEKHFQWKLKMPREKVERVVSIPAKPASVATGKPAVTSNTKDETVDQDAPWREPVSADNIFDSNQFERFDDSEEEPEDGDEEEPMTPEEERYEELENLLDPAEQWSISGIAGDTLGTVLIYSRKKGKLKGDIIDEMGGMDSVAEELLMEAIQKILPSGWSKEDKEFYSRESALAYVQTFVEEYEEETEK